MKILGPTISPSCSIAVACTPRTRTPSSEPHPPSPGARIRSLSKYRSVSHDV
jgi:hypothetical protein